MRRAFLGLLLLFVLAAGAGGVSFWWFWAGEGPTTEPTIVIVAQGAGTARVAGQLEQAGAIRGNAMVFRVFARLFGSRDRLQQGEFSIPAGMSAAGILDLIQHGRPVRHLVTIPEGMPAVMVRERIMALPVMTGTIEVPVEGSILPETYDYRRGESRAALLGRMRRAMTDTLARLWARRRPTSAVVSPQAAIILASIVEKETNKESERRLIAAVYSNRLRRGMPLQADPTVIYPVTQGRPIGRRILRSELAANHGYNTYRNTGLPIGPITNPGRASIAAVLDPQPSEALYFVADGTGGHVFANTLAEHNANVQRWYAIRRSRGEME